MSFPRLVFAIACAFLLSGCILFPSVDLGLLGGPGELTESSVLGEGDTKLLMVEITGLITDQPEPGSVIGLGAGPNPISELREVLELAAEDTDIAGLLLRIQSPGGTVSASETVYHEIQRFKQETELPVVAYVNGLAASGGYYAAMAADEVIAHPTAITGSIGVVMPGVNVSGLMERFGVTDQTFTSGAFKDSGSITRAMRPDEREQLQNVMTDLHARFTEVVDAGRPKLNRETVNTLADGRVYTARQALEIGLVDQIGYLEEAVEALEERAGIEDSELVFYHRSNRSKDNIYSRVSRVPQVNVNLFPWDRSSLAPGFYYLWPLALR